MTVQDWQFQARIGGVFTTIPTYATPVRIRKGRTAFGTWPRASEFSCEVADDLLLYDPSRPTSLLYGVAGRNAVVRIRPNASTSLWGEASWSPHRTIDHQPGVKGRSGVDVTAAGLLQRIGRWEDPIRSPMYRTISARSTSIGHWALEEESGATRLDNTLPAGVGGTITGGDTGDCESPVGAASSARVADGSRMAGTFITTSTSAGWQVAWSFQADALPPTATYVELFRIRTANGYTYTFLARDTGFRMVVVDSDGVTLVTETYTFGAGAAPTTWLTMRLGVEQSGGNVSSNWAWYAQELDFFYVTTALWAGTISRPTFWEQLGNATTDGWHFCHVFGVTGLTDDLMSSTNRRVFNGYKGETVYSRYNRIVLEAGLTRYLIGSSALTTLMGPQRPGTLIELLRECRDTEGGEINDERLDIALTMVTRHGMHHRTPALTLTYGVDVAAYVKSVGDEGIANRVTAKNAAGGEATASLETGLMSVLAPPAGVGEYRKQVDVSVDDPGRTLEYIANWHLARGTLEGPRYTSITVNVVRSTGKLAAAVAVREGDWITVDGLEPDTLRLLVVGIEQEQTSGTHTITYLTEPADVFDVGVWDDAGFQWGTNLSFLDGAHTDSDTTLALTTVSRRGVWSTAFTGSLIIAGERVTVTSMGAASGSGPYTQTATVVRGANGMVKAQAGGAQVRLFHNKKWGL